jgi:FAD/FMN-containing dehydrogenase
MKKIVKAVLIPFSVILLCLGVVFIYTSQEPKNVTLPDNVVMDVTQMNKILVARVERPTSTNEIQNLVKNHHGKISIGGARHSMGGQIATEGSLHLDMRGFDKIISFSKEEKRITVQSGITWRKIQERIDPFNLSIKIMQTYANFTVGGSLSVNVHGRYIGEGPIIKSVESIRVVLADGTDTVATPTQNSSLFFGCIGGYGGLGVITEVTLSLADNVKVERQDTVLATKDYTRYFKQHIRNDAKVIFHNADIYPENYDHLRAISFIETDKPVTEERRLRPLDNDYRLERFAMWTVSESPGGKWLRENVGDPLYHKQSVVRWRNYEASYDAAELEPHDRDNSTYVLQEYFVPVDSLGSFIPAMATIFNEHDANIINVSVRHANQDPGSLLAWAKTEVFCFVIYYKQETDDEGKARVAEWTVALIDEAIRRGGCYYLPYQLHATEDQFLLAYPRANEFISLKKWIDPENKFTNKLWDKYFK